MEIAYHTVAMTRLPGDTAAPKHESYTSVEGCKQKKCTLVKLEQNFYTQKEIETTWRTSNNIHEMDCYYGGCQKRW